MAAPELTFNATGIKISNKAGHDHISVTFTSDSQYEQFECRATKVDSTWGVGIGTLCASFSQTPANTPRTFEIYDDFLIHGDGAYRISLFAQGVDGSWNDNYGFIPLNSSGLVTADGELFLCMR